MGITHCDRCGALMNPRWESCLACGPGQAQNPVGSSHEKGSIQIDSQVLGRVVWLRWSDSGRVVYLDGIEYGPDEIERLKQAKLAREGLRQAHETKKAFSGKIVEGANRWPSSQEFTKT